MVPFSHFRGRLREFYIDFKRRELIKIEKGLGLNLRHDIKLKQGAEQFSWS